MNREDIAFRAELENLKLPDYRLVHVLSDTSGIEDTYQGFINADIVEKKVPESQEHALYDSGVMAEAIKKALATLHVAEERILTDVFIGYD